MEALPAPMSELLSLFRSGSDAESLPTELSEPSELDDDALLDADFDADADADGLLEVTCAVSLALGALGSVVPTRLAVAVSVTEWTEVALDLTGTCA